MAGTLAPRMPARVHPNLTTTAHPSRGDRAVRPRRPDKELSTMTAPPTRLRPATDRRTPRTAFVLAGGARLGALQAGMLRALFERGIEPDLLVGTSAGALNATYLASRWLNADTAKALANVWRDLRRDDVFP